MCLHRTYCVSMLPKHHLLLSVIQHLCNQRSLLRWCFGCTKGGIWQKSAPFFTSIEDSDSMFPRDKDKIDKMLHLSLKKNRPSCFFLLTLSKKDAATRTTKCKREHFVTPPSPFFPDADFHFNCVKPLFLTSEKCVRVRVLIRESKNTACRIFMLITL